MMTDSVMTEVIAAICEGTTNNAHIRLISYDNGQCKYNSNQIDVMQ